MKNVLVTGGAGFIGSNFIRHLLTHHSNIWVINLDCLTYSGNLDNLKNLQNEDRYTFIQGDICDENLLASIFQKYKIDTVVHFAAETHVDRSILNPGEFIRTNVVGTYILLEAAKEAWQGDKGEGERKYIFHHISTDEVFGQLMPEDPPFSDVSPYQPNSPYSASKAASDHLVRSYFHTYKLPILITNCSNNYGPCQYPEKLIPLIILNAVQGKPLPIYGEGKNIRDWLYVEDHCEAIWSVLEKGTIGETYLIGGNNQPTNLEVVTNICQILDRRLPDSEFLPHSDLIEFVPDRPGHDFRYHIDISKIKTELGWSPKHSLSEGLEKTVEWYLSNPDWVEAVQRKSEFTEWVDDNYSKRGEKQ